MGGVRSSRRKVFLAAFAAVAALAVFSCVPEALAVSNGHVNVAVLISHNEDPYGSVVSGFHKALSAQKFIPHYHSFPLGGDSVKLTRAFRDIRKERPDLVLALGPFAVEGAVREVRDIPVIAGLFLRPEELKKAPNATGVFLEFPFHTQFRWLARMLPYAKTVGVLYNPEENQKRVESAERVSELYGFLFKAEPVRAPKEIPVALESLGRSVDILWGLSDAVALTPSTAKNLILFSFRTKIPFVGLSASWVKAGAFYALEWDYPDLGAQCGEMAASVLRGTAPSKIVPAPPRKSILALNLNTAKQIGIEVPDGILSYAGQVYRGIE